MEHANMSHVDIGPPVAGDVFDEFRGGGGAISAHVLRDVLYVYGQHLNWCPAKNPCAGQSHFFGGVHSDTHCNIAMQHELAECTCGYRLVEKYLRGDTNALAEWFNLRHQYP
jgi:hypothetical protein